MYYRLATAVLGVAAIATLPVSIRAQNNPAPQAAAQQESPYKDQGEYDVSQAAGKEADPQKKLDKLRNGSRSIPTVSSRTPAL